jgi:hypothetical protein
MPRKWATHWPTPDGPLGESERDRLIHTIGNLTLLTGPLNSKVSNGPWSGDEGKWRALEAHDVLMLNRDLRDTAPAAWTHDLIRARTDEMARMVIDIWPVPEGHKSGFTHQKARPTHKTHKVDLADLMNAGVIEAGLALHPRQKKHAARVATLLPDGQIDVEGATFARPSAAASSIRGRQTNGWWFFLVDKASRRSLRDVWRNYVDALAVDVEDDDANDGDGDDDEV